MPLLQSAFRRSSSGSVHSLLWCRNDAKLLHHAEVVIAQPALLDLAIGKPEQLQPAHCDALPRRRHARQVARMRGVVGPAFGDRIPLGQQFVNRDVEVWAAGTERAHHLLIAGVQGAEASDLKADASVWINPPAEGQPTIPAMFDAGPEPTVGVQPPAVAVSSGATAQRPLDTATRGAMLPMACSEPRQTNRTLPQFKANLSHGA